MSENTSNQNQNKDQFFEAENKKVEQRQRGAIIKGFTILGLGLLFVFVAAWLLFSIGASLLFGATIGTVLGTIMSIAITALIFPVIFFLMMYFVWGPEDVCWSSFPREGYTKVVLRGREFRGLLGVPRGRAYNNEWDIVDAKTITDENCWKWKILGLYIVPFWPFDTIYKEKAEWQKYNDKTRIVEKRREVLREFSLMTYPFYIEVLDAEDNSRMGIAIKTVVSMKIVNPRKALFETTTSWLDIVGPIIQGGYVSYIKTTTFQKMLSLGDIGAELMSEMVSPSDPAIKLVDFVSSNYGIEICSLSVIDITGSDEEEQKAIKANSIALLEAEAKKTRAAADAAVIKTKADATSYQMVAETEGAIFTALARLVPDKVTYKGQEYSGENYLKELKKEEPEDFEKKYGKEYLGLVELIKINRNASGGKYIEIKTSDCKGNLGDILSLIATAKVFDGGMSNKQESNREKELEKKEKSNNQESEEGLQKNNDGKKKGGKYDERTIKAMKDAGIETRGIEK